MFVCCQGKEGEAEIGEEPSGQAISVGGAKGGATERICNVCLSVVRVKKARPR